MAKIRQIICISLLSLTFTINAQNVKLGIEKVYTYLPLLKEKNIGIIANQSSIINETHLVDSLISLNLNVVTIFSPEHGFRGTADAGAIIEDNIDEKTNIPIISLYGRNKKPSPEQLANIDILLFDLQDVGVRFYTYISTLHYVMEAAVENSKKLILLDRPNPNGHYIDGPIREDQFQSFVAMHPIPIVHAMTIGEYAHMIVGENWIPKGCDLTIIKMENYARKIVYKLPVRPSPNLPNHRAINLYPSLCLFEGTIISIGRGTEHPFQHFGAPYIKSNYSFTPKSSFGSKNPKHQDTQCFGTNLKDYSTQLDRINLDWLITSYEECPDKSKFFTNFFDKLAGTDKLRMQIIAGMSSAEIRKSWQEDLNKFKETRAKYLLY